MIDSKKLLTELESKAASRTTMVRMLEDDLRGRCDAEPEVDAPLRARYDEAKSGKRTAFTYAAWRDAELTQVAVAWVLGCVFVRFLEDNGLVETPKLAGPGARLTRARDEHELFFRRHPGSTEREFLLEVFEEAGRLPGMREFFDKRHNPLWEAAPSGDACRELWLFWQRTDPETGELVHDFTDPSLFDDTTPDPPPDQASAGAVHDPQSTISRPQSSSDPTRFLGDLYQDLSEAARKRFALLQTPDFVEEFILDRTLTPAIETFGFREVRLIDPTCGSGHFLLGAFARLFRIWRDEEPGENPRVLAQKALDGVHGVDLNPFAVAIARFRLLLAALRVCGVKRLADAPDFRIHLAVGDSLLHGARFDREGNPYTVGRDDMFGGDEELFQDELAHFFDTEDSAALHRILGRQYHAVVGNPPYITVKDKALNQLYRERYKSCSGKYALSVPFMERFFDLAVSGSGDGREPAGFTGQITSNSFMKREFGKKLIQQFIPGWDLTHVLDTSGAYIPGHGTPTVILFGRNARPVAPTVRTVMGIKGEPATPEDPAKGKVWSALVDQVDRPGSESEFVSAADTEREKFHRHPWSLQGGGASDLKSDIDQSTKEQIKSCIVSVGFASFPGLDDAFVSGDASLFRMGLSRKYIKEFVTGDCVRDWETDPFDAAFSPYDSNFKLIPLVTDTRWARYLWRNRLSLGSVVSFGGKTRLQMGDSWWGWYRWITSKYKTPLSITFAFVATHNHFVLDRGGKVFNRSAPVIKLPADATEDDHLRLLGLLNSSAACFWMKQVFHCKGSTVDTRGARQTTVPFEDFYEFDGTKMKQFPVPKGTPFTLTHELDSLASDLSEHSPEALAARDAVSAAALAEAERQSADLRARMVSLQEELDWQCYRHYGLVEAGDDLEWPEDHFDELPSLTLGERAFEIRMARQMEASELETTWFERHKDAGSKPVTELPAHWPGDYRALVERRLAFIEANKNIGLIERPEYKRRWNTEPWAKRQQTALRKWLLARLEGYFFEGARVCDLGDSFDPAARGFTAATRPHLVTANQLADVVASDAAFLEAAEVHEGAGGFSVARLVRTLVESEAVPYLPALRYKAGGLRKRRDWETTWELQRKEDEVEAAVKSQKSEVRRSEVEEEKLKEKVREAQREAVGEIPVPPKYKSGDFRKTAYWKLRGKLDVPKERWISYPGAERAGDESLVVAWAGWDHLQQAQALAEYFIDARDHQGAGAPQAPARRPRRPGPLAPAMAQRPRPEPRRRPRRLLRRLSRRTMPRAGNDGGGGGGQ